MGARGGITGEKDASFTDAVHVSDTEPEQSGLITYADHEVEHEPVVSHWPFPVRLAVAILCTVSVWGLIFLLYLLISRA